ncbi:MAG: tape measure protein [Deltaproteobacteria bacterium]|nr:tape measure protein [Deltaproteobacteria bacterium]
MANRFSVESVFKAIDRVTAPVKRMSASINKFSRSVQRSFRKANRAVNKFGESLRRTAGSALRITTVGVIGLSAALFGFIKQASKIEDAVAAFTPLLGSVKRAEELVAKLNKTAASTPFQFDNLSKAAGQLLPVMEGDIDRTIKILRMLGDTAGGNAQKLDSITRGFTKAMLKGKVDMESLNMIAEAGVPIFTELAASMGTEVNAAFFKMISAGKVATKDLTKAFDRMTSAGGVFFEGMVIASRTQSGLFSTLRDNITLTAAAIGQQLLPTSKKYTLEAIKVASSVRGWVENNKDLISQRIDRVISFISDNFEGLVKIGLGALGLFTQLVALFVVAKTVMIAWSAATAVATVASSAFNIVSAFTNGLMLADVTGKNLSKTATFAWIVGTKAMAAAQWLLNIALNANPIGLVVLAVGALIGVGVLLIKNWDNIVAAITSAVDKIKIVLKVLFAPLLAIIEGLSFVAKAAGFLGIGGDEEDATATASGGPNATPQIVSPQERIAATLSETRETSTAEVTIKDETGRAEMTQKGEAPGVNLKLAQSGAF